MNSTRMVHADSGQDVEVEACQGDTLTYTTLDITITEQGNSDKTTIFVEDIDTLRQIRDDLTIAIRKLNNNAKRNA